MFFACGLDMDGVPRFADFGNDFSVLSYYVDSNHLDSVYRDTSAVEEDFEKNGRIRSYGILNNVYACACVEH